MLHTPKLRNKHGAHAFRKYIIIILMTASPFSPFIQHIPNPHTQLVLMVMVQTLHRNDRKPSHIGAVVIDHVISFNPNELMALVIAEL